MNTHRQSQLYVCLAYTLYGLLPIFWTQFSTIPAEQVLYERTLWCCIILGTLLAFKKELLPMKEIFRSKKNFSLVLCSAVLLGSNWLVYLEALKLGKITEASFGYFLCPLLSMLLGVLFLSEKIDRLDAVSILCLSLGVGFRALTLGNLPWYALLLAITFGFYQLLKKKCEVPAIQSVFLETLLLLPMAYMIAQHARSSKFDGGTWQLSLLFIASGFVTAIPLLLLVAGAKQVSLRFLGLSQYLSPSLGLLLAVFYYHEKFRPGDAISFQLIWLGILLSVGKPYFKYFRLRNRIIQLETCEAYCKKSDHSE